jgi:thiol-activated cytolysin
MNFSKLFTKSVLSSLFLSLALGLSACGQSNPNEPLPQCGNGTLEDGEQCDDGDNLSGDGCSKDCDLEDECGDSSLDANEECDDGNTISGDGCNASCEIESVGDAEEINDYVQALEPVPAEVLPDVINSETPAEETEDGNYSCSSINLTKTVPLTEVSILSGITSDLFPGAILRGDSLYNGTFAVSGLDRKPMTYSLSVQDGTSAPRSAEMQDPSLSEFRDTFGVVLSQANLNNVPVSAFTNVEEIRSEQDIDFSLGVDVNTLKTDVKSTFNFQSQDIKSRFLITVDMAFFTADLDTSLEPSDFFADSVSVEDVQQEFNDEVPPVYVSSITYGTRYYVAVESSFSSEELDAALNVAFNNGTTQVDGSVTLSTEEVLQNTSFTAIAVGAQPAQLAAFNAILSGDDRLVAVQKFLTDGTKFSAANIGAPLSFTMKNMTDNSVAALAFSNTTDVLTCERISQNIQATLKKISLANGSDVGNNDLEIYGFIKAQGLTTGTLFNQVDNNVVVIPNGGEKTFTGAQFQKTIHIDPRNAGAKITLIADLFEDDGNSGDDDMPFTSFEINKDSTGAIGDSGQLLGEGFNGEYQMTVFSPEGNLTITVALRPIL